MNVGIGKGVAGNRDIADAGQGDSWQGVLIVTSQPWRWRIRSGKSIAADRNIAGAVVSDRNVAEVEAGDGGVAANADHAIAKRRLGSHRRAKDCGQIGIAELSGNGGSIGGCCECCANWQSLEFVDQSVESISRHVNRDCACTSCEGVVDQLLDCITKHVNSVYTTSLQILQRH